MTAGTDVGPDVAGLFAEVTDLIGKTLGLTQIAEEEIDKAIAAHPEAADRLYHSFALLYPTMPRMEEAADFVYRSHCAELMARVVAEEDTRPGTAVEVLCVCCEASLRAPLGVAPAAVYMRAWVDAFPDRSDHFGDIEHYEVVAGDEAAELRATTARKLAVPTRVLPKPGECPGLHHGEPALTCSFREGNPS